MAELSVSRGRMGCCSEPRDLPLRRYHRLAARRGKKRALIAMGHAILVIAYHMLSRNQNYSDLGENYFDERDRHATENRLLKRIESLGYQVNLEPVATGT